MRRSAAPAIRFPPLGVPAPLAVGCTQYLPLGSSEGTGYGYAFGWGEPLAMAASASMGRADRGDERGRDPICLSLLWPDALGTGKPRDSHGHGTDDLPVGHCHCLHDGQPRAGPVGRPDHSGLCRPDGNGGPGWDSCVHVRRSGVRVHEKPGGSCGGGTLLRVLDTGGDRACGRSPMADSRGRLRGGGAGGLVADLPGDASDVAGG